MFLEEERFVEFHVQYGHYFRTRIPKFGRDMAYLPSQAELYIVGTGSEFPPPLPIHGKRAIEGRKYTASTWSRAGS